MQFPEKVVSGKTVLQQQAGHCFEMSILLTSYLIAAGYDAYVVSGYATKDYCQNNLTRTVCPDIPDISEKVVVEEPPPPGKYTVREPRDLRSKFILMMEQRVKDKEEEERLQWEEEERKRIEELEKPPHDPLYWWGIHSWVAVLPSPNKSDVEQVFFIQPGSGVESGPADPLYLGIESLWNHRNYWVNVQNCSGCKDLQFELRDTSCWQHLLPGEPWEWQEISRDMDLDQKDTILLEKHLDMPASWVQRLHIPHDRYEQRYPLGQKSTYYKKALVEKFAPYLHDDGLVCRVTTYEDYECQEPQVEYQMFQNREDCLFRSIRYFQPETIIDEYEKGREDALMRQTRYTEESRRVMEFFQQVRHDSLKTLTLTPVSLEEQFESREDRLYHRFVTFDPRTRALNKWSITDGTIRRTVTKIIEKFHRNEELVADRDIARREFDITNEEININYHYAEGKITAGTRYFVKPPLADQGDRLKFDSKTTSGYVVDTAAPPQKKVELFWLLEACLKAERDALKHIRDMEDEILSILRSLALETAEPKLKISIFDEERNNAAKQGMKRCEQQLKEQTVREVEAETDYLAVYLVQFANKPLSHQNIMEVRQYCLNEYKQLLVDRANKMQFNFDKLTEELQAKHQWYENLGTHVTNEQEESYLEDVRRLAFQLHALELRLLRHRDLAAERYAALDLWLCHDPRLAALNLDCSRS
ncbi:hypothetical protein J6590_051543 [Homalodisca vitripennis]|nr:hypothetical protein J6590_051543 [Homalodisca vitripennis]